MTWRDSQLWAALLAVEGLGNRSLRRIVAEMQKFQLSGEEFWATPARLPFFRSHQHKLAALTQFKQRYTPSNYGEVLLTRQISVLTDLMPDYPTVLHQLPDRPPVLFIKGKLGTWDQTPIAVVGTRHATAYGQLATEKIVKELVSLGSTVISGFMYGIDLLAHQAAVYDHGQTIGVLGFGFDYMYPASQQRLFDNWLAAGQTFITEYAPNTRPSKGTFLQRNRIVAGLAQAVVVVEAAEKSGSLITAQAALEYNREVLAVPGPINSLYSQGTTWLLNQGATLVTSGQQVWAAIGKSPEVATHHSGPSPVAEELQKHIFDHLQQTPQTETQLQMLLDRPMNQVLTALSLMEVAGWLKKTGAFWTVNV